MCQCRSPWTCFSSQSFQFVLQILSGIMATIPLQAGQEAFLKRISLMGSFVQKVASMFLGFFYFSQRLQQSCSCSSNNCGLVQLVLVAVSIPTNEISPVCAHSEESGDFFFCCLSYDMVYIKR